MSRPRIVGPEELIDPFPVFSKGIVVKGFGRGSKELGIPTANLDSDTVCKMVEILPNLGVYYGWAQIPNEIVLPMVMSIGWNPYYKNDKKSAEVHIIHSFDHDFYSEPLSLAVCGYIREEKNYPSINDLIDDIHFDIQVAINSLQRSSYQAIKLDKHFKS